jgi:chromosome segregation ATPase
MPRKTDGDKIDEMEKVIATFTERLDNVRQELKTAAAGLGDTMKLLADLKTEILLLRKDIEGIEKWKDDLKKEKDESARRFWAFGPNVAGAIVNVLLGAAISGAVAYFMTR